MALWISVWSFRLEMEILDKNTHTNIPRIDIAIMHAYWKWWQFNYRINTACVNYVIFYFAIVLFLFFWVLTTQNGLFHFEITVSSCCFFSIAIRCSLHFFIEITKCTTNKHWRLKLIIGKYSAKNEISITLNDKIPSMK